MQIKNSVYDKNVLVSEIMSEVDNATLKINQPVDDSVFPVSANGGKMIDVPILSLKTNRDR